MVTASPLLDTIITSFVTLFVVIDPPGMGPMFAALTEGETDIYRRQLAVRGTAVATVILIAFSMGGAWLLDVLGISINAFRIAGGLLLFLVAVDMLFAHGTPLRRTTEGETAEAIRRHDISVFPLAIPLIAGPGALTTVVLLMGRESGHLLAQGVVLLVLLVIMALLLACLLAAARLVRFLGVTGTNVITRVLGIILAALAVQFVVDGVFGFLAR